MEVFCSAVTPPTEVTALQFHLPDKGKRVTNVLTLLYTILASYMTESQQFPSSPDTVFNQLRLSGKNWLILKYFFLHTDKMIKTECSQLPLNKENIEGT